jgi:hypothetical protein
MSVQTLLDNELRLFRYLQVAARLRLDIGAYARDKRGGQSLVHYAIDTNILLLFLNPFTISTRDRYAVVFDDDESTATALGIAISRFTFGQLSPQRPLILLPGHDAEARSCYDKLCRTADAHQTQAGKERTEVSLGLKQLTAIESMEGRMAWLEENTPTILELFRDDSPSNELRRYCSLLKENRLQRLDAAVFVPGFFSEDQTENERIVEAFSVPHDVDQRLELSECRLQWEERLKRKTRRNLDNLQIDCEALARLELINRHATSTSHRLVLITGDEAMFAAARSYAPPGHDEDFASLYIRHPRAFLAAPEVLMARQPDASPISGSGPEFVEDWLDAILAQFSDERDVVEKQLLKIVQATDATMLDGLRARVKKALSEDPQAADTISGQWRNHISGICSSHTITGASARAELRQLLNQRSLGPESILAAIDAQLDKRKEETWDVFLDAAMRTGYDLISDDAAGTGVSNPIRKRRTPPITFGSFEKTKAFMREVTRSPKERPVTALEMEARISLLNEDDDTGYARCLAYAFLFAREDRWHVAAGIAQRAIDIATKIDRFRSHARPMESHQDPRGIGTNRISGREALYFKAVANRLRAQTAAELADVRELLERAEAAWVQDKARDDSPKPSNFRFRAEQLSLELSRHLFRTFGEGSQGKRSRQDALGMLPPLNTLLRQYVTLLDCEFDEADEWIRQNVERQIVVDVFMVAALMDKDGHLSPSEDVVRQLFSRLRENLEKHELDIPASRLDLAILDYAHARLGEPRPTPSEVHAIRNRADGLLSILRTHWDTVCVSPYDRERYKYLADATKLNLGNHGIVS